MDQLVAEDSKTYKCTQVAGDSFYFRPAASNKEVVMDATGDDGFQIEVIVSRESSIDMIKYLMDTLDIRLHEVHTEESEPEPEPVEEEFPDEASQEDKN